jgi:hypothetical protein
MTYTSTTRDRYRLAVWSVTAAVAAGAITATGWVAGAAAQDQAQDDSARQAEQDAQARQEYDAWLARYGEQPRTRKPRAVLRQRPVRTRVTTRYITATSPTAAVGTGGTVSTPSTSTSSSSSSSQQPSSSGGGNQTQTQTQTPQPPPPPPPPPTPTSGS